MAHSRGILVHEWIESTGGAENVLDQLAITFPGAPIHCLWDDSNGRYPNSRVSESVIARSPLRGRKAITTPIMPSVWRRDKLNAGGADWILVSSHSFAHHILRNAAVRDLQSFAYVHTPARYIWTPEFDARGRSLAARVFAPWLRNVDGRVAAHIGKVAANSRFVRDRIRKAWDRDATVIYPPVAVEELQAVADWRAKVSNDTEKAMLEALPTEFILGASRMVEYKRLDVVIDAGSAAGVPVIIAGDGPDLERLRAHAARSTVPVHFVGRVSDGMLRALMQLASVYVFPPVEDFGIMPVEAMALGTPTVVNAVGGARESLELLRFGAVAESLHPSDVVTAIHQAANCDSIPDLDTAHKLGERRFRREISNWVGGQ